MFYGRQERPGSAGIGGTGVTVYAAGAGGEQEFRPLMLAELQRRVDAVAQTAQTTEPACPRCGRTMRRKGYATCVVAGPVWKAPRAGFAFRL